MLRRIFGYSWPVSTGVPTGVWSAIFLKSGRVLFVHQHEAILVTEVQTLRARTTGRRIAIRRLLGSSRRTTTRIKPASVAKAFGFSVLTAYPPPYYPENSVSSEIQEILHGNGSHNITFRIDWCRCWINRSRISFPCITTTLGKPAEKKVDFIFIFVSMSRFSRVSLV